MSQKTLSRIPSFRNSSRVCAQQDDDSDGDDLEDILAGIEGRAAGRRSSCGNAGGGARRTSFSHAISRRALWTKVRLTEDSYLTELFTPAQLQWVVLPHSAKRRLWDVFMLVSVMYTAISLPIVLAFLPASFSPHSALRTVDALMDVFFMCDIVLNFNTAVVKDGSLVVDKRQIAHLYAAKWLPLDVAASIPWELIFLMMGWLGHGAGKADGSVEETSSLQLVKILKVPKLLRLGRLLKFLERVEGAANAARIGVLVLLLMLLVHFITSIWFVFAKREGAWLDQFLIHPRDGSEPISLRETDDLFTQYVYSYYTALMMIMGDNTAPTDAAEGLFTVCIVLIGSCINATIFANVANLVAQMSAEGAAHNRKMEGITTAMNALKVPRRVASRIRAYFEYTYARHHDHAGARFIASLPTQLRSRVSLCVHEASVRSCPLFKRGDRRLISAISSQLDPEVYLPAEFILVSGYVSNCMYFIERGRVQLISKKQEKLRSTEGLVVEERTGYFNELALFLDTTRNGQVGRVSARAITHVDMYKLRKERFEAVVHDYPSASLSIAEAAHATLPPDTALVVRRWIYTVAGLPEMMLRWKPKRGLALRVSTLASDMRSDPAKYKGSLAKAEKRQSEMDRGMQTTSETTAALSRRLRKPSASDVSDAGSCASGDGGSRPEAWDDGVSRSPKDLSRRASCRSCGGAEPAAVSEPAQLLARLEGRADQAVAAAEECLARLEGLAPAEAVGRLQQQMSGIEAALAKLLDAQLQASAPALPLPGQELAAAAAAVDGSGGSMPQQRVLDQLFGQRESCNSTSTIGDGPLTARGICREPTAGGRGGASDLALASEAPACQLGSNAAPSLRRKSTTEFRLPGRSVLDETASSSFKRWKSAAQSDQGGSGGCPSPDK